MLIVAIVWLAVQASPAFSQPIAPPLGGAEVEPTPNRYLAFGDSITYGHVGMTAYPVRLEATLDLRVAVSEVINAGKPGEGTAGGRERIVGEVSTYTPTYVVILEGTNDVTRGKPPADVYENLTGMIDNARAAGVDGVQIMVATLLPRLDYLYDETDVMNAEAVWPAAASRDAPVCDLWRAFVTQPKWYTLFHDEIHPNDAGFQLMADTIYACLLASFPDIHEETTPPLAWIEPLPPAIECGYAPVSWSGSDDLSWVVDYDMQAQVGDGPWTDWLLHTAEQSGVYTGGRYGDRLGFRARGRDLLGNQGEYGEPGYTQVADSVPPYEAQVRDLPPWQVAPFSVSWRAADACADIAAYDVQYRAGAEGAWQAWLLGATAPIGSFDPSDPHYGVTYYFRVRAQDAAGNWGEWSGGEASTILARYAVAGRVSNVRHEPVAGAGVTFDPAPAWLAPWPGGFLAYVLDGGAMDISVTRADRFGALPAMLDVPVEDSPRGLQFVLPPQDDVVAGGDFEAGSLSAWQAGGTLSPTLTSQAHTGLAGVRLGGLEGASSLSQPVPPLGSPVDLTLSLMARLDQPGPPGTLWVRLDGAGGVSTPVTWTVSIETEAWSHAWLDLAAWAGQALTVTLSVSNSVALVLDEVRLGSALVGGDWAYLPMAVRH